MVWVIVLGIIGIIFFSFLRDRNKMLDSQVDNHGGMLKKYSEIVSTLVADPDAKVVKVTRDHVHVANIKANTATHFYITENFNCVGIQWTFQVGNSDIHKKGWEFPSSTSQKKMMETIGAFLNKKSEELFGKDKKTNSKENLTKENVSKAIEKAIDKENYALALLLIDTRLKRFDNTDLETHTINQLKEDIEEIYYSEDSTD